MNCFKGIISNNEFFDGVDPECISGPEDYIELVQKSCEITNGILVFMSCNATEIDDKYRFDLIVNETGFGFDVEIYSGTVDAGGLVKGMNGILAKIGYAGESRFCNVNGEVLDFGIAFITPEKERELAVNGFIWRNAE